MRRLGLTLILLVLASAPASANWVASGTFRYQEREWNKDGFTGVVSELPIRFADVEVIDPLKNGSKATLGKGKTNANGAYSISVTDSSIRTVRIRVLTTTSQTSDLFVKAVNKVTGSTYAVTSTDYPNHNPNVSINFGILVAAVGGGGEAFNIFDLGIRAADFVKDMTGSRPNSAKLLTLRWAINGGITRSSTSGNTITLRDTAGYDDTPILHEIGHYMMNNYSKSTNPGGAHSLSDCNEDLRLAFDEGRASFLGCVIRRRNGFPNANIYLRTDGGSGPGHFVNGYDLETELQYPCDGDSSEVTVSRSLWDIGDGVSTTDTTPGVEDSHDLLTLPDLETWQVFTGPIKNATYVTAETFWDGWFDPTVNNSFLTEMKVIFDFLLIEFHQDAFEINNSIANATPITSNGGDRHQTYFYDPGGDGKGELDADIFTFRPSSGVVYTIETVNLLSACNTVLEVLDTNGTTVLASNDDRVEGDWSSLITWTAPRTANFYIRSKPFASTINKYGSYDLRVTNP